jgi:hypothetical protein
MTTGKLASEGVSFSMFVQKMRRDYLRDAIMGDDPNKREFGEKILKNVQKQFMQQNLSKPRFDHGFYLSSENNPSQKLFGGGGASLRRLMDSI